MTVPASSAPAPQPVAAPAPSAPKIRAEEGKIKMKMPDGTEKVFTAKIGGELVSNPKELEKIAKLLQKHFVEESLAATVLAYSKAANGKSHSVKILISTNKISVVGNKSQTQDYVPKDSVKTKRGDVKGLEHLEKSVGKIQTRHKQYEAVKKELEKLMYPQEIIAKAIENILSEPTEGFAEALAGYDPVMGAPPTLAQVLKTNVNYDGAFHALHVYQTTNSGAPVDKGQIDACEQALRKLLADTFHIRGENSSQAARDAQVALPDFYSDKASAPSLAKANLEAFVKNKLGLNIAFSDTFELMAHVSDLHMDEGRYRLLKEEMEKQGVTPAEQNAHRLEKYALSQLIAMYDARQRQKRPPISPLSSRAS